MWDLKLKMNLCWAMVWTMMAMAGTWKTSTNRIVKIRIP